MKIDSADSENRTVFNWFLLVVCLFVVLLRVLSVETVSISNINQPLNFGSDFYSLSISSVLFLVCVLWIFQNLWDRSFSYRFTGIEIGLMIFMFSGVVAVCFASNIRMAITTFLITLAPVFTAVLFVQILKSPLQIKIVLYTITSLGIISVVYCAFQCFWFNQRIIEQYETDAGFILGQLNITANSFQHMLFEHSLYSKDVRGFFTTGNSAGSFALLASFSSLALLVEKIKVIKSKPMNRIIVFLLGGCTLICVAGLFLTHSKGAIAAFVFSSGLIVLYFLCGKWLKLHWKMILLICLLLFVLGSCFVVWFGLTHETLPGGNSTLVRWQYWLASVRMYADYPFTGVGPGNFSFHYSHYKPAAALESVADPHNCLLSLLSQYGVVGLVGFLLAVFVPLIKAISISAKKNLIQDSTIAILLFAVFGFLIHSLIDFTIFEPALLTVFWIILACIFAAADYGKSFVLNLSAAAKVLMFVILAGLVLAGAVYVFFPVAKTTDKIQRAYEAGLVGEFEQAHILLAGAANDDKLNPQPLSLNGRMYIHQFYVTGRKQTNLLLNAEKCLLLAIDRNSADFKDFEKLADVYTLLAEPDSTQEKNWLNKAFDAAKNAVLRYPGCGRLQFKLADIAEKIGKIDIAVESYERAVEIENAYRGQFRKMYPGREMFSRLGEEKYNLALQKIKNLSR